MPRPDPGTGTMKRPPDGGTGTMKRPPAPPPPPPPESEPARSPVRPQRLQGSAVMHGDIPLGYVARIGDGEWALFDAEQDQIGSLIQQDGSFTVFWLGATAEDSFMSLEASNFAMAVAKAFELEGFPRLVSKVVTPKAAITRPSPDTLSRQTRNDPGSRVLHRRRLAGFVYQADMPNVYLVITPEHEQVAIVNKMGDQFQVCLMGQSPDDSMDFENQDDLAAAVGVALELDGRPLIDPPLE